MLNKLKKQKRWICWDWKDMPDGKRTKVPMSPKGGYASSTDSSTWVTYDEAKKASDVFAGIGVIFTPDQQLLGIDIDNVLIDGRVEGKEVLEIMRESNTHVEKSPSGKGFHLYFALEEPLSLTSNKKAPFEIYTSGRFFTFTEDYFGGQKDIRTISKDEALKLLAIIGYPWKTKEISMDMSTGLSTFNDMELLEKMFMAKNGKEIWDLHNDVSTKYNKDKSSEDFALLMHLAFWSNKDTDQMERIWMDSPLGKREKTQTRPNYRKRTIEAVISVCQETYSPPTPYSERKQLETKVTLTTKDK